MTEPLEDNTLNAWIHGCVMEDKFVMVDGLCISSHRRDPKTGRPLVFELPDYCGDDLHCARALSRMFGWGTTIQRTWILEVARLLYDDRVVEGKPSWTQVAQIAQTSARLKCDAIYAIREDIVAVRREQEDGGG